LTTNFADKDISIIFAGNSNHIKKLLVMAKVNFNLAGKSKDPEARDLIILCMSVYGQRVRVSTEQSVPKKFWNSETGTCVYPSDITVRGKRECDRLNKDLIELRGAVVKAYQTYNDSNVDHSESEFKIIIQNIIKGRNQKEKEAAEDKAITPLTFIDNYIQSQPSIVLKKKGTLTTPATIASHKSCYNRLKQFMSDTHLPDTFTIFDRNFETKFRQWATTKYKHNSISISFTILKVWLNEAARQNRLSDISYKNYNTSIVDVDQIALTDEEVNRIYTLDLKTMREAGDFNSNNTIEATRDLFIISCRTGLRLSDWGKRTAVWNMEAGNETLTIITQKTNNRVVIPLHPQVIAIYQKYKGILPKPINSFHSIAHLQKIGLLAGIDADEVVKGTVKGKPVDRIVKRYERIQNHTGRRTFATIMYLKGAPILAIMSITGHKTMKSFFNYIKISEEEHAHSMRRFIADPINQNRYTL
jgi:integrase